MAHRQYIGARYVPLFDGPWDSTKNYEPLTVVEDGNGNSYTSKRDVPAGTPLTDRNYWMLTATFSGAIESLGRRVDSLEQEDVAIIERIDGVEEAEEQLRSDVTISLNNLTKSKKTNGRKFILLGDSFAYGIQGGGLPWSNDGWITAAKRLWGDETVYAYDPATQTSITGTVGFTTDLPFIRLINDAITVPDASVITDIVVLGGTNDRGATEKQIESAIAEFCRRCKQLYPNAKISIGVIGTGAVKVDKIVSTFRRCTLYGASFISDTLNLFCNPAMVNDGTHLTAEGYSFYLPYILNAVLDGRCDFVFRFDRTLILEDGCTVQSGRTPNISIFVSNKGIRFNLGNHADGQRAFYFLNINQSAFTGYVARNIAMPITQDYGFDLSISVDEIISASNRADAMPFIYMTRRVILNRDGTLVAASTDGRVAPLSQLSISYDRVYFDASKGSPTYEWPV